MSVMHGPRIRGRVGTIESDNEDNGKFAFEIFVAFVGDGLGKQLGTWGPFDTEPEAQTALKAEVKNICDISQEIIQGEATGEFIDIKTNKQMNWSDNEKDNNPNIDLH